jgi:hypothetical protein
MDIKTAKELLEITNTNLQKQIDTNNLAISILDDKFNAEFTQMATMQATFDAKNAEIVDKMSTIAVLQTAKETAEATLVTKETEIINLKEQVKNLTPKDTVPVDSEPVTP